jgi:hypothetical protein
MRVPYHIAPSASFTFLFHKKRPQAERDIAGFTPLFPSVVRTSIDSFTVFSRMRIPHSSDVDEEKDTCAPSAILILLLLDAARWHCTFSLNPREGPPEVGVSLLV